ncbi:MAG: ribonuclease III [Imperialibacter sp.]|uniref:ribonuclease III n=1 Tax=Imperialibacter sp. TaxID=2038411 RepID=UPI0032EB8EC5
MLNLVRRLKSFFTIYTEKERSLSRAVKTIVGYSPINIQLYRLSVIHSSAAKENNNGFKESNERLEYLGDAVLGMIVAEYLFNKYPFKDEGFLTEIRSRIVNRESLNDLARKLGIGEIIEYEGGGRNGVGHKSIYGDTLEALIGAVYLDRGYRFCRKFVMNKLMKNHFDIHHIVRNNPNYKSKVIEWAQKENRDIRFEITELNQDSFPRKFEALVMVDEEPFGKGFGLSKKKAEQDAAQKTCEMLNLP